MVNSSSRVHILTTGGTIQNDLSIEGYLSGSELLDRIPEAKEIAEITVEDIASVGSQSMTTEIWYELANKINSSAEMEGGPDGFVVTSGSNTLEETAYFLNLVVKTEKPVVLTASQRNHGMIGNDGDRNLVDAVRVASLEESKNRGVLVVLNDQIHSAREVTKVVTSRPDAWSSGDIGVLGLCDKYGYVQYYRETQRGHAPDVIFDLSTSSAKTFPKVVVEYSIANADGSGIPYEIETGAQGIVYAGFPTGAPAEPNGGGQAEQLRLAAEIVPVVMSHRGSDGWPYRRRTVLEGGSFIWGDTLSPQKAAILLALSLTKTSDPEEIQKIFLKY
ncbi:MAG: asparaginase [Halobacteriales archaeon]